MRLAALVDSPDHVCARYRLRAFEPYLRDAGLSLDLHPLPRTWWARLGVARSLQDADAVILQRKLLSRTELTLLRRRACRLWFDFDDAVWMRDSYSEKGFASSKRERRYRSTMQAADLVVAGNPFLAENARMAGARNTRIIPTCVDLRRYPLARHDGEKADMVWVGSSSTIRGLESVNEMLSTLGKQIPGIRLKLVCDSFIHPAGLEIVEMQWTEASEAAEIAAGNIGISWIPDDPWSRGKCGLKVLQYMAAGLPVVTNPVGVHPEMVSHGESGFLASTPSEWIDAIRTLAGDRDLRRRMGSAGRKTVENRYSVEAGARLWLDLIGDVQAGRATA
jgi:glycosyltransferase involved in cell wall biosynthesis